MSKQYGELILPALRAAMGDWVYYICFMRMENIAERISAAEETHTASTLRELLQRALTKRATKIADYLTNQKERFFNALVIGTYGGNPQWSELNIKSNKIELPSYLEGTLGILILSGKEILFAIDGQHRVVGIRKAVERKQQLKNEEVAVILLSGVSQSTKRKDAKGFERTRRLFTTLNRYAKPVNKKDIIALDEDDVVAIVTRRLVEEHILFREKVNIKGSARHISASDKTSITTIVALYDALDTYLRDKKPKIWSEFRKVRPSDGDVELYYKRAMKLWDAFVREFIPLRRITECKASAGDFRHNSGGHLLFRPIGLLIVIRVLRLLMNEGYTMVKALRKIKRAPFDMGNEPWTGILWDKGNRRVLPLPANQDAAKKLLYYSVGGDLRKNNISKTELTKELAGILNKDIDEISLPRY